MMARDRQEKVRDAEYEEPMGMRQEWEEKYGITKLDIEALQRVFRQLDSTSRGKIGPDDLALAFERLDYEPPAITDFGNSEIEDMIWEVDEDADGFIDWPNFVLLYGRARVDKASREPRRLFRTWACIISCSVRAAVVMARLARAAQAWPTRRSRRSRATTRVQLGPMAPPVRPNSSSREATACGRTWARCFSFAR